MTSTTGLSGGIIFMASLAAGVTNGCSEQTTGAPEHIGQTAQAYSPASYTALSCPAITTANSSPYPTTAGDYVEGYVDRVSYGPDETINVYASSNTNVTAFFYRIDSTKPLSHVDPVYDHSFATSRSADVPSQPIPFDGSECGARWNPITTFQISPEDRSVGGWGSGLFAIELVVTSALVSGQPPTMLTSGSFQHRSWIPFVLKPALPVTTTLVAISATNTWHAYDVWPWAGNLGAYQLLSSLHTWSNPANAGFGHGYYLPAFSSSSWGSAGYSCASFTTGQVGDEGTAAPDCMGQPGKTVNFQHPVYAADPGIDNTLFSSLAGGANPVAFEREALHWLNQKSGASVSLIADSDDTIVTSLDPATTPTVVLMGHNEYWTNAMLTAIDGYLRRGGHLLNLAGNVANWAVDYLDGGNGYPANNDQMVVHKADGPPARGWQSCSKTDHFELAAQSGALSTSYLLNPGLSTYGYTAGNNGNTQHFFFTSPNTTGLSFGASLAANAGAMGWKGLGDEVDVVPASSDFSDFSRILIAPTSTAFASDEGYSGAGMTYVGRPHGGGVFSANSVSFADALDGLTDNSNPSSADANSGLTNLLKNVLHRFDAVPIPTGPGDITGYSASNGDPPFASDFWCHVPSTATISGFNGLTYVADMRTDGAAHYLPSGSGSWTNAGWCGASGDVYGMGDFNGDKKLDAYCYHTSAGTVDVGTSTFPTATSFSTGAGNHWKTSWSCAPGGGVTTTVGDVDGDGRDDLVCHNGMGSGAYNGYTWVALSNGTSFGATQTWQTPSPGNVFCGFSNGKFGLADVDGDGKKDAWCFNNLAGNTYVALSRSSTFNDPYNSTGFVPWLSGGWCSASASTIDFGMADFNGDGFADAFCHNKTNGANYLAFGRGEYVASATNRQGFRDILGVGASSSASVGTFCTTPAQYGVGDFDGDGLSDFFCHSGGTTNVSYLNNHYDDTGTVHGPTRSVGAYGCSPDDGYCVPDYSAQCTSSTYSVPYWELFTPITVLSGWCDTANGFLFGSATGNANN